MSRIFVNYRVGDSASVARVLHEALVATLGAEAVFFASETIEPGRFFDQEILTAVRRCEVLLAVIGPHWQSITRPDGRLRLDDEHDWVRREIAEALALGIRVVPVLVENARVPQEAALPAELRNLARCQYVRLGYRKAEPDIKATVQRILALIEPRPDPASTTVTTVPPEKLLADENDPIVREGQGRELPASKGISQDKERKAGYTRSVQEESQPGLNREGVPQSGSGKYVVDARGATGVQVGDGNNQDIDIN